MKRLYKVFPICFFTILLFHGNLKAQSGTNSKVLKTGQKTEVTKTDSVQAYNAKLLYMHPPVPPQTSNVKVNTKQKANLPK